MAGATVRVHGLREVNRAFRMIDRSLATNLGVELKQAAEPVRVASVEKISRYRGVSLGTIRSRRTGATRVWVEQSAKKVTGKRGDFGNLQMMKGLEPALDEHEHEVFADVERVLRRYAVSAGF